MKEHVRVAAQRVPHVAPHGRFQVEARHGHELHDLLHGRLHVLDASRQPRARAGACAGSPGRRLLYGQAM